jgi:hypothetical protein
MTLRFQKNMYWIKGQDLFKKLFALCSTSSLSLRPCVPQVHFFVLNKLFFNTIYYLLLNIATSLQPISYGNNRLYSYHSFSIIV